MKNISFTVHVENSENLEFIGKIKKDGSGIEKEFMNPCPLPIDCVVIPLSKTEETYINPGMNSYIVKLKK